MAVIRPKQVDIEAARNGSREACGRVVKAMEGAVKKTALHFCTLYPGLDMDDLIQCGNMAVIRSVQRYDPARGSATFVTYCYNAILNTARRQASKEDRRSGREIDVTGDDLEEMESNAAADPFASEAFQNLEETQKDVLALRLGPVLNDKKPPSWKWIGAMLGMTAADVEAVYTVAVASLRVSYGDRL